MKKLLVLFTVLLSFASLAGDEVSFEEKAALLLFNQSETLQFEDVEQRPMENLITNGDISLTDLTGSEAKCNRIAIFPTSMVCTISLSPGVIIEFYVNRSHDNEATGLLSNKVVFMAAG